MRVISRRFDELSAREFHDIARLRGDVFVVEQDCAYADLDGRDLEPATEHHWLAGEDDDGDGPIVCYARSLAEHDGTVRIGRVVTARSVRGRGLAGALIAALLDRFDGSTIVLDAQSHLADWYAGFGFDVVGDEFLEDGIPHVPMAAFPR